MATKTEGVEMTFKRMRSYSGKSVSGLERRGEGTHRLYEDVRSMTGGFVGRKCL